MWVQGTKKEAWIFEQNKGNGRVYIINGEVSVLRRCPLEEDETHPPQFLKRALNTFVILLLNLLKTVCLPPSFNGKWNRTHAAPQFAADSLCTVQSAVSIVYRLSTYNYTFLNIVINECLLSHHHNIRACLIWVSIWAKCCMLANQTERMSLFLVTSSSCTGHSSCIRSMKF